MFILRSLEDRIQCSIRKGDSCVNGELEEWRRRVQPPQGLAIDRQVSLCFGVWQRSVQVFDRRVGFPFLNGG
ncbi:MAG: hypothetical protein Ct9H300mP11_12440 [Chloroflexota bacterium]|nr:MAG: hypothetical protein Ct9H300mP11_12440 [Chloroflexota bacterium]